MSTVTGVVIAHGKDGGQSAIFSPGDTLPEWAVEALEGHKFLVADDAASGDDEASEGEEGAGYGSLTKAQLVELIEARNAGRDDADRLPTSGKNADLVATLMADDAASDN